MRPVIAATTTAALLLGAAPVPAAAQQWVLWEWTYRSTLEQARDGGQEAQLRSKESTGICPTLAACLRDTREAAKGLAEPVEKSSHIRSVTSAPPVVSTNPRGCASTSRWSWTMAKRTFSSTSTSAGPLASPPTNRRP